DADAAREEHAATWQVDARGAAPDRDGAAALGSALHALIERFDWSACDPDAEWTARVEEVRRSLVQVGPALRDVAVARALGLLDALRASARWEELRSRAPNTIARELPVLLPGGAEADDAVGCTVGAIDWVYWDPVAKEIVVVDFKTDRIEKPSAIAERRQRYRLQAERDRA